MKHGSLDDEKNLPLRKVKPNKNTNVIFVLLLVVCSLTVGAISFLAGRLSVQRQIQESTAAMQVTSVQNVSSAENSQSTDLTSETLTTEHTTVLESSDEVDLYVYATRTGKKYHRADCSYIRSGAVKMTRQQAEESGLAPCSVCKP